MNGKRLSQLIKSKPEKVNSLLTSGEDVLISDAHIIKNGTPGIALKDLATLYKVTKRLHSSARSRGSGVCSTWYCGAKAQQVAHSLPEWYNLPQVFNNFPFFLGVETYQGIYRLLQYTVPLRALPSVLFRTTILLFFLENKT